MRIAFNIVAHVLVFFGAMGPAGSQCVAGHFMSGQMRWACARHSVVAGIACWWGLPETATRFDYRAANAPFWRRDRHK